MPPIPQKARQKAASAHDANIADGSSLHDGTAAIREITGHSKISLDYSGLKASLDTLRERRGWRVSSLDTITVAVDPSSEGQQRFQSMLSHSGFQVDAVHFRDFYPSPPPGRSPHDSGIKSTVNLSPRLAYLAGLMARHEGSQVLFISHAFELFGPLSDLAQRLSAGGGRVGLAYFRSLLLDDRWRQSGILDETPQRTGVEFFDLDEFSLDVFDVDFRSKKRSPIGVTSVLSQF